MKEMTVLEFLKETEIDRELEHMGYAELPLTIFGLLDVLDDAELNYWSYDLEDKDEVKDWSITVLVTDNIGRRRYFELAETIVW